MDESWSPGQWLFTIVVFLPCIVALLALNIGATFVSAVLVIGTTAIAMFHPIAALAMWFCSWLVVWFMIRSRDRAKLEAWRHRELIRAVRDSQRSQPAGPIVYRADEKKKRWWRR